MPSKTILVADDSATMRMIVQATLASDNWSVLVASNGKDALTAIADKSVDLVVTDWNMPVMGGLGLIQGLRASPKHRDVPVLVLTTEEDQESKLAARDLGVRGWLGKPVDPDVLLDMATEILMQPQASTL
ncbi:response regulator [Alcaligenaceae bacterium B3P038]|nr:response regulator [Alcaligenaceae bacterium B3P038]